MKKKTIKKLRLEKIKVAKLSAVHPQQGKDTLILVSGALTVCGASICVCSWPTEDC